MTRKDFVLLAEALRDTDIDDVAKQRVINDVGSAIRRKHPRFDFIKWQDAILPDNKIESSQARLERSRAERDRMTEDRMNRMIRMEENYAFEPTTIPLRHMSTWDSTE